MNSKSLTTKEKLKRLSQSLDRIKNCRNCQGKYILHKGSYGRRWMHYHPCPICEPNQKLDQALCRE
jgi:hypothetical protein